MNLTTNQIRAAYAALGVVVQIPGIKGKLGMKLALNLTRLEPLVRASQKPFSDLVEAHAKKDDSGRPVMDAGGNFIWDDPQAQLDFDALLADEYEVQLSIVKETLFHDMEIPVGILAALMPMIEMETP
jgi:hypothetical protein